MKGSRAPLLISVVITLVIATIFVARNWTGTNLGGALINVDDFTFNVEVLTAANPQLELAPGQHGIVTLPTEEPPLGSRWATPEDFTGATVTIYEFSPGYTQEKAGVWDGDSYNLGSRPDTLEAFTPGRTYYIQTNVAYTPRFYKLASDPQLPYDIVLHHDESPNRYFGPAATDKERGDLLRLAISQLQNADTLELNAGTFDIDCRNKGNIRFPNNIVVFGQGMNETHLYGDCWSDGQGGAFEVRSGTFMDLSFENNSWQTDEDGRTIEMYNGWRRTPDNVNLAFSGSTRLIDDPAPGPFTANFDRVKFIGTAWVIFEWTARGHTWNIRDSFIIGGRQGISMMAGGGAFQTATITNTVIDIDTTRSKDVGWTSNINVGGGYGLVVRGGTVTLRDSTINMKCGNSKDSIPYSFVPRCVGVYDGNDFDSNSSAWTWITLNNNTFNIDGDHYGTMTRDIYDFFMTNTGAKDKLVVTGGCGSGTDCAFTKNW